MQINVNTKIRFEIFKHIHTPFFMTKFNVQIIQVNKKQRIQNKYI